MQAWTELALVGLVAGLSWCAGWWIFYRSLARVVRELRSEIEAERKSRDQMLQDCLQAIRDQRDDSLRVLGDYALTITQLAEAVRGARR